MSTFKVIFDGTPATDDFYDVVGTIEIEENADLPDAITMQLPVSAVQGDLSWVGDDRVKPFANIAVVATPAGGSDQCIFDGYVLSHKVHVPAGVTAATVDVWGQDSSVLMGLTETAYEWSGLTDSQVANTIFGNHGVQPSPDNGTDDSPAHTDDGHTLMQRGSDIDFLRRLARKTGRWCRVMCADQPGARIGYFGTPSLTGDPVVTLDLNDPDKSQVPLLDFSWDVARPTKVAARQASLTDSDQNGVAGDSADSGLAPLDARTLAAFAGRDSTVLLTASADAPELSGRARAVLRESGWFARCEGTADLAVLKTVLRVGTVVAVEGVGQLLSGKHLVWSVRHTITPNSHTMAFTLVRNSVGPAAASSAGGLP